MAIKAINDIGLDHYLLKPWHPPEERLYSVLDDLLSDWREQHPEDPGGVRVIGHRWSDRSHEVKMFLARNHVPYQWLDLERDDEARRLQDAAEAGLTDLPLVLVPDREALRAPSTLDLADALGLRTIAEQPLYDLCIVGAGPAGLAAAVYGASEGLQTVVIEREGPGGQASQSAAIENYLGFPKGVSGADLTHRAVTRRGASAPRWCSRTMSSASPRMALCAPSASMAGRRSRRGPCSSPPASPIACSTHRGSRSSPVGASTTAPAPARRTRARATTSTWSARPTPRARPRSTSPASPGAVVMVVRADALEKSMSEYLIERIRATENIEVRLRTEVVAGSGTDHLEEITLADRVAGTKEDVPTNWLFVFIGASPRTDWLGADVARDERGFVITGPELASRAQGPRWPLARSPFVLETSVPGLFAAGDVRLDSMKRVASAVGEGAIAVYHVHRYLATT